MFKVSCPNISYYRKKSLSFAINEMKRQVGQLKTYVSYEPLKFKLPKHHPPNFAIIWVHVLKNIPDREVKVILNIYSTLT